MRNAAKSMIVAAVFLAVAAVIVVTRQQQEPLGIEKVKDGLYIIMGSGGNVGVRVTSEGVILIDDKFPQNFSEIQERVQEVTSQPVTYVLNTHHHGDHSGGNVEYIKIAEIIAHQNARDKHDQREPGRAATNCLHGPDGRVSRRRGGSSLSPRSWPHER